MPQAGIRTQTPQFRLLQRLRDGGQERMPDDLDWTLLNPFQFTVHWTREGHTNVYTRRGAARVVDQFHFHICSLRSHSTQLMH
jgi:hypothetical protein